MNKDHICRSKWSFSSASHLVSSEIHNEWWEPDAITAIVDIENVGLFNELFCPVPQTNEWSHPVLMSVGGNDVRGTLWGYGVLGVLAALGRHSRPTKALTLYLSVCFPEASKLVMSYVAAVCGKGQEVNKVKEQLLQSNPVLEGRWCAVHPQKWLKELDHLEVSSARSWKPHSHHPLSVFVMFPTAP